MGALPVPGAAVRIAPAPAVGSRTALQVTTVSRNPAPLAVGDLILAVNGAWVTSEADLNAKLRNQSEADVVVYKVEGTKTESRKVAVGADGLGVAVQAVTIDLED